MAIPLNKIMKLKNLASEKKKNVASSGMNVKDINLIDVLLCSHEFDSAIQSIFGSLPFPNILNEYSNYPPQLLSSQIQLAVIP